MPDNACFWRSVDARAEACTGTACADYESCFLVRASEHEPAIWSFGFHQLAELATLDLQAVLTRPGDFEARRHPRGTARSLIHLVGLRRASQAVREKLDSTLMSFGIQGL